MTEPPLAQRVELTHLAVSDEFAPEKRFTDARGEGHLILNDVPMRRVGLFTLNPGAGWRGGHWHRLRREYIYIVEGKGRAQFNCPATGERLELALEPGDRLRIEPGVAHRFLADETLTFVEVSDRAYSREDDMPVAFPED
ncbi:MAG: cupin domain-containing protein [Desulfarculaceae bacterium]|nr:cupin domain-containing protein [Desulfarculaceae bacterium]MCF8074402.1 cupin domain-containing protein [Desulfarculaceae bacterium]MCF8103622.1 cupin domain-containing protein [Desulfarculaceae bacterium]MCF8116035.1 cupin domain-containing protein [Desulfarculaceae bacterium]